MTTFQALIYAIIHGMSEFLPISSKAHHILFPYLIGWQIPTGAMMAALTLGSFLALLIYFRHDWASMISSLLQVIIYRKRPMTIDERMPLFICITTIPILLSTYYFHQKLMGIEWTPLITVGVLAITTIPLGFADSINRKTKGMFDWTWFNAAIVGIFQSSALVPGWDPLSALLLGAFFFNFKREAAVKYAYFSLFPILLIQSISYMKELDFHTSMPMPDMSWLSFGVALITTLLVGLLAIGGFMKHVQQKGLHQYIIYRWVLAIGVCGFYWYRNR